MIPTSFPASDFSTYSLELVSFFDPHSTTQYIDLNQPAGRFSLFDSIREPSFQ